MSPTTGAHPATALYPDDPALGDDMADADMLLGEAEASSMFGGDVLLILLELVMVAVRPVALLQVGPTVVFFPITKLTAAHCGN